MNFKKITFFTLLWITLSITIYPTKALSTPPDLLSIENEFIKLILNNKSYDTGRFSIETTGGNPSRVSDNHAPLIFGRPKPWTSYTSFQLDNDVIVFGGKTKKRAGKKALFGSLISQEVSKNMLISIMSYPPFIITQTLSFYRNPLTNVKDMAAIDYEIHNTDTASHNVAARIMLDTMLGKNDAAPFRIGSDAYYSEQVFKGKKLFDYWQTFDNIASPNIIAQGIINAPDLGVFPPEKMILANWGTLADEAWDFRYKEGRSFIRSGELEKDTALAMYWKQETLAPKQKRKIRTLYGLGGVTLSPGDLSLGLSAPAEISAKSKTPILIIAYILNTGGFDAKDIEVTITLPKGLKLVNGQTKKKFKHLVAKESQQIALKVLPTKKLTQGQQKITLHVSSSTLEDNALSRIINVLATPHINGSLTLSKTPNANGYFNAKLLLHNPSKFAFHDITAHITLPNGMLLTDYDHANKSISYLPPKKNRSLNWQLKGYPSSQTKNQVTIQIKSPSTHKKTLKKNIPIKEEPIQQILYSSRKMVSKGDYFYISVAFKNMPPFSGQTSYVLWDESAVNLIRLSPDLAVHTNNSDIKYTAYRNQVRMANLATKENSKTLQICKLHFKALQSKKLVFRLYDGDILSDTLIVPSHPPK